MFEHKKLERLEDFFVELNQRREKGIYFYRIDGWNTHIEDFLVEYYQVARRTGVVIDGKLPNPDEKNLSYYVEVMGMAFEQSVTFIEKSLGKWLPRMNTYQRQTIAHSIYDTLDKMQQQGKNINMLKNAYIKYMCWLYYKFERILGRLGDQEVPKILYGGSISDSELKMITILAHAGCDVMLVQYDGDESYKKLDASDKISYVYRTNNLQPFEKTFTLKQLHKKLEEAVMREKLYGKQPSKTVATNTWITGNIAQDLLKSSVERGEDTRFIYNCFYRLNGVDQPALYLNELYQLKQQIVRSGKKLLILEHNIPQPTPDEIKLINRKNYTSTQQVIQDLTNYIQYTKSQEIQSIIRKVFVELLTQEANQVESTVNRITNKAIYLICWFKRYQNELFEGQKSDQASCCFYLGVCQTKNEALFLRFLAMLPIDVVILRSDLSKSCLLEDQYLYEVNYNQSLVVTSFPRENTQIQMGTAAYHAERELDTLLYQESGIYRNQQYKKATSITLKTMYEELFILWDQELKYRENFSVTDQLVNIPVLCMKVSGVKEGNTAKYWESIRSLYTEDTLLIKQVPYIVEGEVNPIKAYTSEFFKNGKIQREKIKAHRVYNYGVLREEMQEHILDKLQLLIDQKIIKGTFVNGTEYTIIATVLNMNQEILRMIQKFDFTKKNPKIIYLNTTEKLISLEDSILIAFLNLVGFDLVFFVPTGYQSIEKHFEGTFISEYQIGEYLYDLNIPHISKESGDKNPWYRKIFRRGE